MAVMEKSKKKELLKFVSRDDLKKADDIPSRYINKTFCVPYGEGVLYGFKTFYYDQRFYIVNKKIEDVNCNCYNYMFNDSCIHVASVLSNHYNKLINTDIVTLRKELSENIMNDFNNSKKRKVKKLCSIGVDIKTSIGKVFLNLKVGEEKLYIIKSKASSFFNSYYNNEGVVKFGKQFEYDPNKYYFTEEDQALIDFAYDVYHYGYSNNEFALSDFKFKQLLSLSKNKELTINGNKVIDIKEYDQDVILDKKDGDYILSFDINIDTILPLTEDFEYVYSRNEIIHFSGNYAKLVKSLIINNVDSLIFSDINKFSNTILPIVKNEIEVTDNIDNLVIVKKPNVKLYFDLNYSNVSLDIKFDYKNNIISYFDKDNSNIMRDHEYEEEVVEEILKLGFSKENKIFLLDDYDEIGILLDEKLDELALKYEVFTSEKLKNMNIVKESHITSTFSIGKDNVMSFNFELGEISNKELVDIFDSLKKKKKYFKLKSGNLLDLRDENIRELESLSNDMNLSNKDISNGSGEIPKYRAIYYDSLKKNRYNIIRTNNLFDKFIDNFKAYKDVDITFRSDEKILRDYQKIGVKWLYNIHKCDFGGILADEMGLGKSLQTLCFIRRILDNDKSAKVLIVTPTSLCYNWEKEIEKFTPEVNYHIFTEARNKRRELIEEGNNNVYITSYGLLREDIEYYKKINFSVFIIDEAQNIKNPATGITKSVKSVKAKTRIALTGTPIENSLSELWSIFDFIMPGFFGSMREFNDKYGIKEIESDDDKHKLNDLNRQISPFILRRKKKDVVSDLPDKIENNIYIDLTDNQKELYAALVEKTRQEMDDLIGSEGFSKARFKILELLTRLRQMCIDPSIIYDNYKGGSAKIDESIKVIKEVIDNDHKILLFSSFRTALNIVEKRLKKENISYYLIDGSVSSKKRMELVEKFNNDETKIFLIMLKAGGTGLNLTGADVVIHLDLWWNPQVENQATDRAHRIGQKNTVEVIKLITKGTIEEKILELQQKKKVLSDSVIEGDNRDQNLINKLSEKDIKELLATPITK